MSAADPAKLSLNTATVSKRWGLAQVNGREIMLDRHEGEELTYVGVIAADKEGEDALLVDLRYMK